MRASKPLMVVVSLVVMLSIFSFLPGEMSAEDTTIELVDSNGDKLDGPLINKNLEVVTYTSGGVTKYSLLSDSELTKSDYYLRINSASSMTFNLAAFVPDGIPDGSLKTTGLNIQLIKGDYSCQALIDSLNGYKAVFQSFGHDAVLDGDSKYLIRIYPAVSLDAVDEIEPTSDFTLRFEITAIGGYTVEFYNGIELVESRVVAAGEPVGELLPMEDTDDYVFSGWYDSDGRWVTPHTIVNSDMNIHARWSEVEPEDVVIKTEETIIDEDSVTEKVTETTIHKDGSIDVVENDYTEIIVS